MDSFIHYAVAAADFAMKQAGLDDYAGTFRASGRIHRVGHRRIHDHRARTSGVSRRRPAQDFSIFYSIQHYQSCGRPGFDSLRRPGPELGALHGVLFRRSCCRRCISRDLPRRCRRHDLRRFRSRRHADGRRRVCRHARLIHPQRRTAARFAAVRQGSRWIRRRRRRRCADSRRT